MNKTKVETYQEVLRDVSRNFKETEEFAKHRIQEIPNRKKHICGRGNLWKMLKACVFSVTACC